MAQNSLRLADQVEAFVREVVIPYEKDPRRDSHGPRTILFLSSEKKHGRRGY